MVKNFTFKKSLGQNFLLNQEIAQEMVGELQVESNDIVLEVGPGNGMITKFLLEEVNKTNSKLLAVEIDIDLIPILQSKFGKEKNLTIINANIINFLEDELPNYNFKNDQKIKFIGSLPYGITSPLLHKIIKLNNQPQTCVFLIQKEVAQKISAKPPKSNYLSVFVQTFYETKIINYVNKNLFYPIPKVDGAIIKLNKKKQELAKNDIDLYENFVHHAFSHPRKMLNKIFTPLDIKDFKLDPTKRAHDYGWEQFKNAFLVKRARN